MLTAQVCLPYRFDCWFKLFAKQVTFFLPSFKGLELRDAPLNWTVKVTKLGIYFADKTQHLR